MIRKSESELIDLKDFDDKNKELNERLQALKASKGTKSVSVDQARNFFEKKKGESVA